MRYLLPVSFALIALLVLYTAGPALAGYSGSKIYVDDTCSTTPPTPYGPYSPPPVPSPYASVTPTPTAPYSPYTPYGPTLTPPDGSKERPFCTIQEAVDYAKSGNHIIVRPGIYTENVTVSKRLSIEGARKGKDASSCTEGADASVVNGSFNLLNKDIVLDGFTIQGNAGGPGVQTSPNFAGYEIQNNIIQNHVMGIYLNTAGNKESEVSRNCIRNNTQAGAASGNGVYSDQGLQKAVMERNRFSGNPNASLTITTGPAPQPNNKRIEISRNTATGERTFLNMYNTTNSEISRNTATAFVLGGSAIFLGGDTANLKIERNVLRDADFSGIRIRNLGDGLNTNIEVRRNVVTGMGDFGIAAGSAHNDTPDPGTGLALTKSKIEHNEVDNNGDSYNADGILMGPNTDNNRIEDNDADTNQHHDAHDDSVGSRTDGTANRWDDNDCTTENKPHLCD